MAALPVVVAAGVPCVAPQLLVALLGHKALGWGGDGFNEDEDLTTRGWLFSKALSIAGGTSEVQLNIIAKRVLGLPQQ